MLFKSAEIRWFSKEKEILWELYHQLFPEGEGNREPDRTDYYLLSDTPDTGIKIREGSHELKVKSAGDEPTGFGILEHWIKWSTKEEKNILNTIDQKLLGDWIPLEKGRYKKVYEILNDQKIKPITNEWVEEGCGAEFTEVFFPLTRQKIYTLGLEAFSAKGNEKENLISAIKDLNLEKALLKSFPSYSYPEMLRQMVSPGSE